MIVWMGFVFVQSSLHTHPDSEDDDEDDVGMADVESGNESTSTGKRIDASLVEVRMIKVHKCHRTLKEIPFVYTLKINPGRCPVL